MSSATNLRLDRRERPRAKINSQINYRITNEDTAYNTAKMLDLSQTGVLIRLHQKLDTHTQLTLQIDSDVADEEPIEILAEVIRIAKSNDEEQYNYGCAILDIINF